MRSTDPVDGRPLRHARVWLDPATWRASLRGPLDVSDSAALDAWIAAGRAVVARRRESGVDDRCGLGVALPLSADRRRIGFAVDPRAIVRIASPLALVDVLASAPVEWRVPLQRLHDRAARIGTTFHVYGSLAWQAIAGEACVRPGSDVDLLWTVDAFDTIDRVLRLLTGWEEDSGLRADGEVLLPNGDAVAWRELTRPADRVLVKHQDGVSLQRMPDHRTRQAR